jgi:putative copper resistance protein D
MSGMPMPPGGTPMQTMHGLMWMPSLPPTIARLFAFHLQPVPILPALAIALLLAYLLGVSVLRRRGDRWPITRTIWWTAGVITLLLMTATGFDGYGMELFSVHMVQHMVINMLTPVLLVLGAPVTLLLRALPARRRGSRNVRSMVLAILHSSVARFLTHPVVTLALFLLSLYGLYFTSAFDYLMGTMWGHNLMLLHFLAIGCLYFWGIIGVDPSPRQSSRGLRQLGKPGVRILELAATVPFHAFFGIVVMMSAVLIVHFYATPIPGWGISPLSDQQTGGGIAWGFTEFPTLIILGVLFAQWQSADARQNRNADRKAARDGDAELNAYNARLAAMAASDHQGDGRS